MSILVSSVLVDRFAEPAMWSSGPLAGSVDLLIGTGAGRGIGLALVIAGSLMVANGVSAWLTPAVRRVEVECSGLAVRHSGWPFRTRRPVDSQACSSGVAGDDLAG